MNQRWVCKRCFADNEDTALACAKCGLTRGADVAAADQAQWQQAAGPPAKADPGWTKWLKFAWIPVVVVVLAVGYLASARRDSAGNVEAGGTLSVFDLQAGDCFDISDESATEFSEVNAVPCTDPHPYQVFNVTDHETDALPTEAELTTIFETVCVPAFETFVGTAYADSVLWASLISPSQESFSDGDREYACYLFELDASDEVIDMTASMQGANR